MQRKSTVLMKQVVQQTAETERNHFLNVFNYIFTSDILVK